MGISVEFTAAHRAEFDEDEGVLYIVATMTGQAKPHRQKIAAVGERAKDGAVFTADDLRAAAKGQGRCTVEATGMESQSEAAGKAKPAPLMASGEEVSDF